jgi:hypothetical protein
MSESISSIEFDKRTNTNLLPQIKKQFATVFDCNVQQIKQIILKLNDIHELLNIAKVDYTPIQIRLRFLLKFIKNQLEAIFEIRDKEPRRRIVLDLYDLFISMFRDYSFFLTINLDALDNIFQKTLEAKNKENELTIQIITDTLIKSEVDSKTNTILEKLQEIKEAIKEFDALIEKENNQRCVVDEVDDLVELMESIKKDLTFD